MSAKPFSVGCRCGKGLGTPPRLQIVSDAEPIKSEESLLPTSCNIALLHATRICAFSINQHASSLAEAAFVSWHNLLQVAHKLLEPRGPKKPANTGKSKFETPTLTRLTL